MSKKDLFFAKYHGNGNDFIILNGNDIKDIDFSPAVVKILCNRHFGIGADGLIIVEKSNKADFDMKYFNSNGNIGTFCGNGARCAIAFAYDKKIIKTPDEIYFTTSSNTYKARIIRNKSSDFTVEINIPDIKYPNVLPKGGYLINTGSPHLVVQVDSLQNTDVYNTGKELRYSDELKPEGANINFICCAKDGIFVRTYERGIENETLSCGSGAIASAIVWALLKNLKGSQCVNVETNGGKLLVNFNILKNKIKDIKLSGYAIKVFEGRKKVYSIND